jgi:CubicO group peptidase (beta-lactamase class C family)
MFRLVWHPREATKMPRIAFIFLIALLPFSSSVAAKEPASKPSTQLIDDVVANEMRRENIAGLSFAIVRNGELVRADGYGFADLETHARATPETVYRIGSVSKQFIAAGVMLLVEQRKLGLEDNIVRYLQGAPRAWDNITVRHLLTHTSGLVRKPPSYNPLVRQPDNEMIRNAYAVPLQFSPGDDFSYSNVGYYILAEIIRIVTGDDWTKFIQERLFAPASMITTRPTTQVEGLAQLAKGYSKKGDGTRPITNAIALRPSGAFLSTVLDLARWDATLRKETVLSEALRRQMWTPVQLSGGRTYPYGFGWRIKASTGTAEQVYHSGSQPGFRAYFHRYLDDGLTIIILTNSGGAKALAALSRDIAALYLGKDLSPAAADEDED